VTKTGQAARDEEHAAALGAARRVLVTGFATAPLETAALACDLAEALGAAVDLGFTDCGQVAGPTIARVGVVSADPGELRDRADLVVFWFCDEPASAGAFRSAFVTPTTAAGRPRRVLAVGPSAAAGEGHVAVPRAAAVELARLLHAAVAGVTVPPPPTALATACTTLHAALEAAGCVAFVTSHDDAIGLEPWSLAGLVRALAHHKPAFEVPLAGGGEAAAVCTWRYGAAGAIAAADRMGGEFLPAEADAPRLIERGEADCVVAVGHVAAATEAAIATRGPRLTVIRADAESLPALVAAVRAARAAERRP